jgi:peptidoglycan/xylan/chitin deacetylase (PgdA/CDA1 family)
MPRRKLLRHGPKACNAVCLTFDDGPHPEYTPALLDLLAEHGVRATFFVIGSQVALYPDLIVRMEREGHLVGMHSYSHGEPSQTSSRQLLEENRRCQEQLQVLLGKHCTYFRPPHGRVTARKLLSLWVAGMTVVLWNVDTKDYACHSAEELRDWFHERPFQGGDLVLMHDNRSFAIDALPDALNAARERGLTFVTADQWAR